MEVKSGKIRGESKASQNASFYTSLFFYSARVSCVSDDIFWFLMVLFCDNRTRGPAANVANPQSNPGTFVTTFYKGLAPELCVPCLPGSRFSEFATSVAGTSVRPSLSRGDLCKIHSKCMKEGCVDLQLLQNHLHFHTGIL